MSAPLTLRVLGTSVTLLEPIRLRAEQDLGIRLEYRIHDTQTAQRIAVMRPDSYDLYDQWFHNVDFVWPARAIQPIDTRRVALWDEINDLPKRGRLHPGDRLAGGSLPCDRLFVQHDGSLGSQPSERISMLPLTHNADSFAYRPERLPAKLSGREESWAWLLDEGWCGHIALQSDAAIGALDAAMALQARGLAHFDNIGNLRLDEIDRLAAALIKLRRHGHFAAFWSDDRDASELMLGPNVHIQSLWSPTLMQLHRAGVRYRLAVPREGYRAWFGGLSLSRCVEGRTRDAAYAYLNWWLAGWPGALMARQGFYISNPPRARDHLSAAEWDYWYAGKAASESLPGSDGQPLIEPGEVREGGSYAQRMGHIGVWNSVMDEHNYLVRKWSDFLRAGR
ncbi:ABC transporter substrate-binding protein [Pseudomonas aeruginosa]|uniref:ABC transporter substrate-binding protein n=1 Tax=Pseudomonas aeruginosa TaxID=287 RepID=UPI00070D80BE|nr:extracellular solute-binding protein [Pseudomonas aeruginosa]MDG3710449.1 extracellular solute-binding protein [Pseudomonas aeruginosa]MDG3819556.1 extracellular solute-binding protein [Pseudomonas aeruginosa]NNB83656.1 signal peptide prediction [Pseudomonas aeruginosa]NPW34974.1 signal peptide prediction [Pseudomonas aeruginosa]RUB28872.1 signal peptide prediction [Pseudomonas aeruginosa]